MQLAHCSLTTLSIYGTGSARSATKSESTGMVGKPTGFVTTEGMDMNIWLTIDPCVMGLPFAVSHHPTVRLGQRIGSATCIHLLMFNLIIFKQEPTT